MALNTQAYRRPHQIQMLFWALIHNAYPSAARKSSIVPPLQWVRQIITTDRRAYEDHRRIDTAYSEFIFALWEEISQDSMGLAVFDRRIKRINRKIKLFIGIGVELPQLQFTVEDREYLWGLRILAD